MKKVFAGMMVILTVNAAQAAETAWDHENNIRQGVKLFDAAYKQGGMAEAEKLSKDCHKNFAKNMEPQFHELCAAIDIAAMAIDAHVVPQASLQRKYFQSKAVDGRLRKELSKAGHNKSVQGKILKFWGDTAIRMLDDLSNEPTAESSETDKAENQ